MKEFRAKILKIGINPYALLPAPVLKEIFKQAGKDKGHIPVCGTINDHKFVQTLVKYSEKWRLYINTPMRKVSNSDVGDIVRIKIKHDPKERRVPFHPKLEIVFRKNGKAKDNFLNLSASRQKEILRYINSLKTEESVNRNIEKIMRHLLDH
jgi:Bacteriocin-protection, YdeI or OmpD-Associated/Domain of unknown function (DUF1905)